MTRFRQWLARKIDPHPRRIGTEQYDLILKAARRCAHDLAHCADDVHSAGMGSAPFMTPGEWHERAQHWRAVFYPDGGPKDYEARIRLEYEREIARLKRALRDAELPDAAIPF